MTRVFIREEGDKMDVNVRSFWLKNAKSTIQESTWYSLNDISTTGFLNTPSGLGLEKEYSFVEYSGSYQTVGSIANKPNIEGELIFKNGYDQYSDFIRFLSVGGLQLVYKAPWKKDRLKDYYLVKSVELSSIEKTEIDYKTNCLHAKVVFIVKTPWLESANGQPGMTTSYKFNRVDDMTSNCYFYIENTGTAPMPLDFEIHTPNTLSDDYRYNIAIAETNEIIGTGRFHNGGGMADLKITHAYTKPTVTSSYNDPNGPMSWQDFSYSKGSQWVFLTIPPMTKIKFVVVSTHHQIATPTANLGWVIVGTVIGHDTI